MCVDLSLGFPFCSTDLYFCLCASTILSWWLCVEPEVRKLIPPVPFFFLKIALAIRGFLYFHTNCEIIKFLRFRWCFLHNIPIIKYVLMDTNQTAQRKNSASSPFWTYSPNSGEYLSAVFFMLKQQTHVYFPTCTHVFKWVKWSSLSHVQLFTTTWTVQARILEWIAFPFSRASSQPRDWTQVSRIAGRFIASWATREAQEYWSG